jgi:hypothetical protein
MTASVAAAISSYVGHEHMTSKGLPFGAKLAGFSFKDFSYPWSMEFWGATRRKCRRRRDKAALVLLVITCAGLAVSAGPARATLMRPRLDDWPAGDTDFWIALPQDDLFSTKVMSSEVPISCMSDTGDSSRPSGGWETIIEDYIAPWQQVQAFGYLPDTFRSQV